MTLRLVSVFAILISTVLTVTLATAQIQTITATHTYVMGDNDSRNDARQLCFLEAKRKVLEKAGSFIQTSTEIKNFQLTKDQISSYSAAVLSVEITKEDFGFSNGHNTLTLTVKANVDIADVQKRLAAIVADKGLQDRIAGQQQQIQQLEQQVQSLNSRLSVAPVSSTGELRKERSVVFGNLEELDRKKLIAIKAITEKTEIIRKYIVRNMNRREVADIVGVPRSSYAEYPALHPDRMNLNYGDLWICFDNDLVNGIGTNNKCDPNQLR